MISQWKAFGSRFQFLPKSNRKAAEGQVTGRYPFYTSSPALSKRTDTPTYNGPALIFGTGGSASVHFERGAFSTSSDCLVAAPLQPGELESLYCFHYLRANLHLLEDGFRGAGLKHVSKSFIEALRVPLVDPSEQRRVAGILERGGALRVKRGVTLGLLKELPRALFLEMFGDPVVNSRGWPQQKLSALGALDRGVSRHRPRNAQELLGGPYPFVQTGDVANSDGYIRRYSGTYSELGLGQSKLWPAGTLCITIAANIAKTGILTFEACFPDSVVGFTAKDRATVEYVRVWLSFLQKMLEDAAPESAQKNINLAILRDLWVPVPPESLRCEFAERLGALGAVNAMVLASEQRLQELQMCTEKRVFTGSN